MAPDSKGARQGLDLLDAVVGERAGFGFAAAVGPLDRLDQRLIASCSRTRASIRSCAWASVKQPSSTRPRRIRQPPSPSRSTVSVTDRDRFTRSWNLSVRCSSTGRSREGRAGTGQPMSDFKMAANCPRRMIASFW
jgi:hypothetical protein